MKFSKEWPVIDINGEMKAGKPYIHISDNGIGMKEENEVRIFQAFQKFNTKSDYEGSGIGLAICKRIVDLHSVKSV